MKVVTVRCVLVLERSSRSVPGEKLERWEIPLGCQHYPYGSKTAIEMAEHHLHTLLSEIDYADTIGGQIEELGPSKVVGSAVNS